MTTNKEIVSNFTQQLWHDHNFDIIDQVFHSLTVCVRYWLLFILHDLENQSKQIFCVKGVFKGAELVQDATQSPDI